MSRLEKHIERKNKKRKRRSIYRIIFILIMSVTVSICLIIIDTNANIMLGNETYIEKTTKSLKELQPYIQGKIESLR
ncbi:hypothetical protein EAI30_04285 [Romboutsia ilealis]|uniref:Uncharacterized protein n=1 Tax=Romboutsia faecis TaxID=2764597 RepID=A0ABR7JLI5_9FIRM|nr:hypothetical protein [Romboutsia faecis]MBC5995632.1 hypothetical protein [Romboutsia faecis]MRN23834.1 hypothetical protein [Romboutsia ilealis]